MSVNLNEEIAQRIMGWEVPLKGYYRDPKQKDGPLGKLPEFCVFAKDHELLCQTMRSNGYELTVTENPPDATKGVGKTFTACFERKSQGFRWTADNDRLAVCAAALKAHGLPISNDQ